MFQGLHQVTAGVHQTFFVDIAFFAKLLSLLKCEKLGERPCLRDDNKCTVCDVIWCWQLVAWRLEWSAFKSGAKVGVFANFKWKKTTYIIKLLDPRKVELVFLVVNMWHVGLDLQHTSCKAVCIVIIARDVFLKIIELIDMITVKPYPLWWSWWWKIFVMVANHFKPKGNTIYI